MNPALVRGGVLVAALMSFLFAGCAGLQAGPGHAGNMRVITAEEIARSGAVDAWEILERTGSPLQTEAVSGTRSGGYISEIPRVIVDGIQMLDVRLLRDIPAGIISRIRIQTLWGDRRDPGSATDYILIDTRG